MQTIKNVTQLFVASAMAAKTATAGLVIDAVTDIADGEVCVVDPRTNAQITTAGYPAGFLNLGFKLIQRSGNQLIHSDLVRPGTVKSYSITLPATYPASEQLDYVGYNGTSGSLDVFFDNLYTLRLYVLPSTISGFMQQKIKEGFFKSGLASTQSDIAAGLHLSLVKNYSREPVRDIRFERISSAAATASSGGVATVTYGSTRISIVESAGGQNDAGLYNADAAAAVVGDFIRFGVAGVATLTDPVYRIVAISGTAGALCNITLDVPFQGATGTFAAANLGIITSAAGLAGDFGLKIQGIAQAYDGKFFGMPVTWTTNVDFNEYQATTVTNSTTAAPGTGTYDVLARLEKELQADEYIFRSFIEGAPVDRTNVLSGTTYDVVVIEYDGVENSGLGSEVRSPKTLVIVSAGNSGQTDEAAIGWLIVLNNIIVTQWATPGAAALIPTA